MIASWSLPAPGQQHQADIGESDGVAVVIGADIGGVFDQGRPPVAHTLGETGWDRLDQQTAPAGLFEGQGIVLIDPVIGAKLNKKSGLIGKGVQDFAAQAVEAIAVPRWDRRWPRRLEMVPGLVDRDHIVGRLA